LQYGLIAGRYDGCCMAESTGGGVVILPWTRFRGVVHVGLVAQLRPLQGGRSWNAPRGFVEPDENPDAAAERELYEETGHDARGRVARLPGEPANPNSAFFDTSRPGTGVRFYAIEFDAALVHECDGAVVPREPTAAIDDEEEIQGLQFVPWPDAAMIADMFTNAAVARLLAQLRGASGTAADADP
jgi:8-oxo-dGTP pyrophosphatase MutT (NUDIX family)